MAAVIRAEKEKPLARIWEVPDELWDRLKPIILRHFLPARTGRPRTDLRWVVKRSSSGYARGASGTHWRASSATIRPCTVGFRRS